MFVLNLFYNFGVMLGKPDKLNRLPVADRLDYVEPSLIGGICLCFPALAKKTGSDGSGTCEGVQGQTLPVVPFARNSAGLLYADRFQFNSILTVLPKALIAFARPSGLGGKTCAFKSILLSTRRTTE